MAFWLQAIAVWYFAVILGMGLVVLALSYALRRWSGWRPAALLAAGAGGVALGVGDGAGRLALLRDAQGAGSRAERRRTRWTARRTRSTYLTTQGTWLAKLVRISFASETTLFPGLLALGLAALAAAWIRADRRAGPPRGWPERLLSPRDGAEPGRREC